MRSEWCSHHIHEEDEGKHLMRAEKKGDSGRVGGGEGPHTFTISATTRLLAPGRGV